MTRSIEKPAIVQAAGNKPKVIEQLSCTPALAPATVRRGQD
jgi:hypothetical protein